jgi:rRNA processing protein Krr1/Pno1
MVNIIETQVVIIGLFRLYAHIRDMVVSLIMGTLPGITKKYTLRRRRLRVVESSNSFSCPDA